MSKERVYQQIPNVNSDNQGVLMQDNVYANIDLQGIKRLDNTDPQSEKTAIDSSKLKRKARDLKVITNWPIKTSPRIMMNEIYIRK